MIIVLTVVLLLQCMVVDSGEMVGLYWRVHGC